MTTREFDDRTAIAYLLGRLDEHDASAFEALCFGDGDLTLRLEAVRDDLVDSYVLGRLAAQDREAFERHFLSSPFHVRKTELATALIAACATHEREDRPWRRKELREWLRVRPGSAALAAAILAVLAGGYAVSRAVLPASESEPPPGVTGGGQVQPEPLPPAEDLQDRATDSSDGKRAESGPDGLAPERSAKAPRQAARASPADSIPAFVLPPATRAAGEGTPIRVPTGARSVRFLVDRPEAGYQSYRASLTTIDGREVWSEPLPTRLVSGTAKRLSILVEASVLAPGTYVLRIVGGSPSGEPDTLREYALDVSRR